MLLRPMGVAGSVSQRQLSGGDLMANGEVIGALTTAGAGTWTAALIAGGIIRRTGPGGGYTDTTDTANNIIAALAGNDVAADVLTGVGFRLMFINTVAQAMTFAAGRGVIAGLGTLGGTASLVREYLLEILNATPEVTVSCGTTNTSTVVTFDVPQALGTVTPGMLVTGAGITAGTRVAGLTLGFQGVASARGSTDKITGITLDANATATAASGVALIYSPVIRINGLREGTL
jgi:hypothetical protein